MIKKIKITEKLLKKVIDESIGKFECIKFKACDFQCNFCAVINKINFKDNPTKLTINIYGNKGIGYISKVLVKKLKKSKVFIVSNKPKKRSF